MNDEDLIVDILRREGGYVDHPADRGGPTKYGVTMATLAAHRGREVSAEDVRDLPLGEAVEIYRERYLQPFAGLADAELREACLDAAVQHGVRQAALWLQRALGTVKVDGIVGPITTQAANAKHWRPLCGALIAARLELYGSLIARDRSQGAFALGWMRRMGELVKSATRWA